MKPGDLIRWRCARGDILCIIIGIIDQTGYHGVGSSVTVLKLLTAAGEKCTVPMNDHYDLALVESVQ